MAKVMGLNLNYTFPPRADYVFPLFQLMKRSENPVHVEEMDQMLIGIFELSERAASLPAEGLLEGETVNQKRASWGRLALKALGLIDNSGEDSGFC